MNPRRDTTDVPNTFGLHLGLTESFGVENLRFGLAVALPLNTMQAASPDYADEREQYFSNQLHVSRLGEVPAGLQTNNPGFPGWEAGGWVVAGGVTLTIEG